MIVPAVEMIVEADQLGLSGKGAGETDRHQRCLGARAGKAHPLGGRDQCLDPLGPFDLQLVTGAVVGAAVELGVHRRHDLGMAMPEQQRAVPAKIIDIATAVDIPFARAPGPGDVEPVGLDVARIMGDAGGEQLGRTQRALRRAGGRGAVRGDNRANWSSACRASQAPLPPALWQNLTPAVSPSPAPRERVASEGSRVRVPVPGRRVAPLPRPSPPTGGEGVFWRDHR